MNEVAQLKSRIATSEDTKRLFEWRNDQKTREMSINCDHVDWNSHVEWFNDSLKNPNREIYVVFSEEIPCATYRLDIIGDECELSLTVDPKQRGKGIATKVIELAIRSEFAKNRADRIVAHVKADNLASMKAFLRNGFIATSSGSLCELEVLRSQCDV
jgi:UDP-2,4-diacetamido-2,4,6-trideoxy-beta-L-altropyranose hydrolase